MHGNIVLFATVTIFQIWGFRFQLDVCNECHGVLMMFLNLSNIAISNICGFAYSCIIITISKIEVVNLLQNVDLSEKMEHWKI